MGIFRHPVSISRDRSGPWETFEAVVDTGAFYSWMPASVLTRLGIIPVERLPFDTADGRIVMREVGEVVMRLDGRQRVRLVVFGDEGTQPLLGADALEGFMLGVDPVHHQLVPIRGRV